MKMSSSYLTKLMFAIILWLPDSIYASWKRGSPDNVSIPTADLRSFLEEVLPAEMSKCGLIVMYEENKNFFDAASLFQKQLLGLSIINLREVQGANLLAIKKKLRVHDPKSCMNYLILITEYPPEQLFNAGVDFWKGSEKILIIVTSVQTPNFAVRLLNSSVFRLSSRIIVASKQQITSKWSIFRGVLYKGPKRQGVDETNERIENEISREKVSLFANEKAKNFEGFKFLITALEFTPFVIAEDMNTNEAERYRGMELELLALLSHHSNFTYKFTYPADGDHGVMRPNGTWTGLIGMVGREEADFAIGHVVMSAARQKYIDYSAILVYDTQELVTPRAMPLPAWQGPLRPLSVNVWICLGLLLICSSTFIWGLTSYYADSKDDKWFRKLSNCLLHCTVAVLGARHTRTYERSFGRLYLGTWFTMTMIICIFYRSSLISFLISPGFTKPIRSFEDLIKTDLGLESVEYGGYLNQILASSSTPLDQALNILIKWKPTLEGILDKVVAGKVACSGNRISVAMTVAVKYTDQYGKPLLTFTGDVLQLERISWPFSKDSPFASRFNNIISTAIESGLMNKFYENSIRAEKQRLKNKNSTIVEDSQMVSLKLSHFEGPFFIMFIGCGIAIMCFALELILHK